MVNHPHLHRHERAKWKRPTWRDFREADHTARAVWIAVLVAALATVAGLVAVWPSGASPTSSTVDDPSEFSRDPIKAQVVRATIAPCSGTEASDEIDCVFAELKVAGVETEPAPRGGGPEHPLPTLEMGAGAVSLEAGDDIYVEALVLPDETVVYSFYDFQREGTLQVLAVVFILAVLLLGRWRGVGAIAGLLASLIVIVVFLLPSILEGHSPVLVAVIASSAIAFIALYFAHGFSTATSVALIGTFASLALTALLSSIFIAAADLTGFTDDSSYFLSVLGSQIDMRGILLAGFVVGALGVLDDVTVTQVSAVAELRRAQPDATTRQIFRSAMNIGRDHISSTVNTLFLAYAGAALPLLLLFTQTGQSTSSLAGREVIATEIVRSLVGSIGLVSAVPITTWLAVRTIRRAT